MFAHPEKMVTPNCATINGVVAATVSIKVQKEFKTAESSPHFRAFKTPSTPGAGVGATTSGAGVAAGSSVLPIVLVGIVAVVLVGSIVLYTQAEGQHQNLPDELKPLLDDPNVTPTGKITTHGTGYTKPGNEQTVMEDFANANTTDAIHQPSDNPDRPLGGTLIGTTSNGGKLIGRGTLGTGYTGAALEYTPPGGAKGTGFKIDYK